MRIVTLAFILGVVLPARTIHAEIVLDDFDDPASAVSPEMENVLVSTSNVGALQATRRIGIGALATDPSASIDSDTSANSRLAFSVKGHHRTSTLTPQFSMTFRYDFTEVDLSENGANNAILFEFDSISGIEGPLFFRSFVRDNSNPSEIFESVIFVPLDSGPTTIAIPFSSFHYRASGQGSVEFERVTSALFSFFFFGNSEDIEWSAQLNRVSFGSLVVPEPQSASMCLAALTSTLFYRKRRRILEYQWS